MTVQADAVDSSLGPIPSFLPPDANAVAQALLSDATLRSLTAAELARKLHVRSSDASIAIGSIIAMINATAHGAPDSALRPDASLSGAIGPFISLDQAMSRFGSAAADPVRSPSPSPSWGGPDVGSDRQFGAGAMMAGAYQAGALQAGELSPDLDTAASMMLDYLQFQGCGPDGTIGIFQDTYNAAGYSPKLVVDSKYGPLTKAATGRVISDANQPPFSQGTPTALAMRTAPAACVYAHPVFAPAAPATPSGPSNVLPSPGSPAPLQAGVFSNAWFWAGVAAVGGVFLLSRSKHPPKWVRQIVPKGHRR